MWLKQCHKPPMTGNGKPTTYKDGDDWGMVPMALSDTHYYGLSITKMWFDDV